MITSVESLFVTGNSWPPKDDDTKERLDKYKRNENLFIGKHQEAWQDVIRKLRGDRSGDIRLVLNFFKRLSLLWADLVCGESPSLKVGDGTNQDEIDNLNQIINDNSFWAVLGDAVIDLSKFGDALLKVRYQDRSIIENVPPCYWFPIVEASNIKQVKAHLLAYEFEDPGETTNSINLIEVPTIIRAVDASIIPESIADKIEKEGPIPLDKISYLKVEIHTVGQIEHRLYRLKDKKIDSQIDLNTFEDFGDLEPVEDTELDDFALIVIHNITSTQNYHGMNDYDDITDIIRELEWRYAQIFRIEDKFSDPSMYGPPIEEQDPKDGEYKLVGGSRYIALNPDQAPPGMITWDGQLPANFSAIDGLMERLYEISETCKVVFDASAGGQGLSAQALRIMLLSPLKKANRLQSRLDPAVKKVIQLCSALETNMNRLGATDLENIQITWHDGMPKDNNAEASRDGILVSSRARSSQGLMREKGFSDEQIAQETSEMTMGVGGLL